MIDEEFEEMRAELRKYMQDTNRKLIENWCKEAKYTRPVGYYNDLRGTMTIYAEYPGHLIGRTGIYINKFKEVLKKEFHKDYEVRFEEIRGEIVNCMEGLK